MAEEGLDIPDCNLIIRFDLYRTMIQYIQSRGRARHENSTYIHMVEENNQEQMNRVVANQRSEHKLRAFCQSLPEDRKLMGNDVNMELMLAKDRRQRRFTHPESKAVLSYRSSIVVLAEFTASLPHPIEVSLNANYTIMSVPDGFVCEVLLPPASPIRSAVGRTHSTKQVAKCAAAYEMCLQLLKDGYLTAYLKPIFTKQLPAMRNARLAISSKKKAKYIMRMKPELWSLLGTPVELFATVLWLQNPEAMSRVSRPLVLLTRQSIPQISAFPLFFGRDRASDVECVTLATSFTPSNEALESLTSFSLRIFADVFSKEYGGTAADMPYFLAPCAEGHDFPYHPGLDATTILDWVTVSHVHQTTQIPYSGNEPDTFFQEKYIWDPYDGSRKFFLRGVRRDLKPRDPVPDGIPLPKQRIWLSEGFSRDILNYSVSLWSKARARRTFREEQPVVEAELVSLRRNLLDDRVEDEELRLDKCFLILEPLKISAVSIRPCFCSASG